jgi:uncharacterized protein (TIGR02147 family)
MKDRRHLPVENLSKWVYALDLHGDDAKYFDVLVRFGQAADRLQRERAYAELAAIRIRARAVEIDGPTFRYLSHWTYPVIRELVAGGMAEDLEAIAHCVVPSITVDEARDAVDVLLDIGMLERQGDRLVQADPVVRTSAEVAHLGSYAYHRAMHAHAGDHLERLWDATGEVAARDSGFFGMTLAVPHTQIPELRQRLVDLQMQIAAVAQEWQADADRVVQLNLHMFPMSAVPEGSDG